MPFCVKKGAADPFRGDWYISEQVFNNQSDAVAMALKLTQENFNQLQLRWDQYGYEWSVFEQTENDERKIWEGYKAIQVMQQLGQSQIDSAYGVIQRT
jgi:hypothetical protein